MFQFPRCPPYTYVLSIRSLAITQEGFPHSETLGSSPAYGSPRHFGVRPVLLRHLTPRHPPCALPTLSLVRLQIRVGLLRQARRSVSHVPVYTPSFAPPLPCTPRVSLPSSLPLVLFTACPLRRAPSTGLASPRTSAQGSLRLAQVHGLASPRISARARFASHNAWARFALQEENNTHRPL